MNPFYDPPDKVAAWHERRRSVIGASDAAAVAGLSPWATALGVWVDKVKPPTANEMTEAQATGLAQEPAIAKLYQRRTGIPLAEPAESIIVHAKHPFMGASIDRLRPDRGIVELKNVNGRMANLWGDDGTDQIPDHVGLQVAHQMACADTDRAEVAALIGGCELRVYPIPRNESLIARLIEIEAAFWDHVLTRTAPPPDWNHPTTAALIAAMYPPQEGEEVTLDDAALALVEQFDEWGEEEKKAKAQRAAVKARLIERMGTAALALLPNGRLIARNTIQRKAYTVDACEYVDFRIRAARRSTSGAV